MKDMNEKKLQEIVRSVKNYISAEREAGVKEYFFSAQRTAQSTERTAQSAQQKLEVLRSEVLQCHNCQLAKMRTNVVFGEGNPDADLVFVGEAPGFEEDMEGRPFVGRAGRLLTKIIEAMKLTRQDVFICNILKCRPPDNRDPLPSETALCKRYLLKQLEIIKPKLICCLGRHAFFALMPEEANGSISTLRGRFFDFNGIRLMPTFHPAYLLRNPQAIKIAEQDYRKVLRALKD